MHLTPFVPHVGMIVRREQLLREAWGPDKLADSRSHELR
jgi:hypothetical protein